MFKFFIISPLFFACLMSAVGVFFVMGPKDLVYSLNVFFGLMSIPILVYIFIPNNLNKDIISRFNTPVISSKFIYCIAVFVLFIIIFASVLFIKFGVVADLVGNDLARFEVRKQAGFGFMSKFVYWGSIALVPSVILVRRYRSRSFGNATLIILIICSTMSGSKAGIVWLLLTALFSAILIGAASTISILLSLSFSLIALIFTFIFFGGDDTFEMIFLAIVNRMSVGAAEGLYYVSQYVSQNHYSLGYFSFVRPFSTLAASFGLIDRSLTVGDTGVFLANYFYRDNAMASYTITPFGVGYLDFGYIGGWLYCLLTALLCSWLFRIFMKSHRQSSIIFLVPTLMLLAHWCDWGWVDGIIVYAAIYVFFVVSMLWIFRKRLKRY